MITSYIAKVADVVFAPLLNLHPLFSLLFLSFLFSIVLLLYQRRIFSKKDMKEIKRKMDEIKEKMLKIQGKSQEELNKLMDEMLKVNAKLMKENLKVILFSLFIGILILSWISFRYSGYYLKLPFPFLNKLSLIYFYMILCIILGIVLGKFLEVR
jgi:uncharacterized membrane protein (DUF106 family)